MSYHVDPTTLLFDELTPEEANRLLQETEELVVKGTTVMESEAFQSWCKTMGYEIPTQRALVMAVAYPQRAFLSFIRTRGIRACVPFP